MVLEVDLLLYYCYFTEDSSGWLSHQASAFSSGLGPRVLGWSPASGSLLSGESAPPSPSAPPLLMLVRVLSLE